MGETLKPAGEVQTPPAEAQQPAQEAVAKGKRRPAYADKALIDDRTRRDYPTKG